MLLLEWEGKELFKKHGIPVPKSLLIKRGDEIKMPEEFGPPFVVKGQYLAGGRGKAGAVKIVRSQENFVAAVNEVLNIQVGGAYPSYVLIEEFIPHIKELYLSILVSKPDKGYLILAAKEGGVDVEELARREGALLKLFVDPLTGLAEFHKKAVSKFLLNTYNKHLMDLVGNLYKLCIENELLLAEINPLALLEDGKVVALDSKIIVDDNSDFRQDLKKYYEYTSVLTTGEKLAKEHGFSYVPLRGDIGIMGNGAGLTMATLDLVDYYGGRPACFIDIGGGASEERILKALQVMIEEVKPKIIFINIFGGITRCDDVARAIVAAFTKQGIDPSRVVIRLTGTNEDIGEAILRENGFNVFKDMDEAAIKAVELANEAR
ncbi:MAG: succinate--CoA ligase subunit beta [Candidatus Geothermarchaeota archaeon]